MGGLLSKKRQSSDALLDVSHTRSFVYHRVLRRNFHFIAEHAFALIREAEDARPLADELVAYAAVLADLLIAFNAVEDEVVFPQYTKRLSVAMDEFISEHKKLSSFCQAIKRCAEQVHTRGAVTTDDLRQLRRSALAISMAIGPLFQKKELAVTKDMLRIMPLRRHRRLAMRAYRRMRTQLDARRGVIKGVVFYALSDSERPLFDTLPDNFKNPVIAAEWKEAMLPYLSFVYNPPEHVPRSKIYETYATQEQELDRPLLLAGASSDPTINQGDKPAESGDGHASGSEEHTGSDDGTEGTADKTRPGRAGDAKKRPLTLRGTLPRKTEPPENKPQSPPKSSDEEDDSTWSSTESTDRPGKQKAKKSSSDSMSGTDSLLDNNKGGLSASNASKGSSVESEDYRNVPEALLSPRGMVARKRQVALEKIDEERRLKEREAWENHRREIERERAEKQKNALIDDEDEE